MGVCPFCLHMGSRAMTNNTTPRMPHLKQILLWIAIWAAIFIVFRIIGWGVGEACDGTINCLI